MVVVKSVADALCLPHRPGSSIGRFAYAAAGTMENVELIEELNVRKKRKFTARRDI
jgi:hypothetical protein